MSRSDDYRPLVGLFANTPSDAIGTDAVLTRSVDNAKTKAQLINQG